MILHVDIDAFFASVEQLLNPSLRDRPVLVGSGCIASCSYEARRYGLHAGMSLRKARRLCPEAVILDGSEKVYRCYRAQVMDLCAQITPAMEAHLDDAYLDLAGTARLYGHPTTLAALLRQTIRAETGLTVTVGVARNRMLARIATSLGKPDGLYWIRKEDEDQTLESLSISQIPGVGRKTAQRLRQLGIETAKDLQRLGPDLLVEMFGKTGQALYERCRGKDTRVISTREIPHSISRATTFHRETSDREEIEAMLFYLTERAMRSTRALGLHTSGLTFELRYADGRGESASHRFRFPQSLDRAVQEEALKLLQRVYRRRVNLRYIGVILTQFSPDQGLQPTLFDPARQIAQRNLQRVIDSVRDTFGHQSLVVSRSIDLMDRLDSEPQGFILRTPSLTR